MLLSTPLRVGQWAGISDVVSPFLACAVFVGAFDWSLRQDVAAARMRRATP